MATIVRIKRNLNEEPLDAVVLNCKRRKIETLSGNEEQSAIFRFIGTAKTQDEDVLKHIGKSTKTDVEEKYKKHVSNITEKLRQQIASSSKNNRFKVTSCQRSIPNNEDIDVKSSKDSDNKQNYTIYDIEAEYEELTRENNGEPSYLYDLYYAHWDDFQKGVEDNELISVYPLSDQLIYGSYRDNGFDIPDDGESEDSNDENNWRNDYPDESDMESITEDDMLNAMKAINLDHENSLSSDDEYNEYSDEDEKVNVDGHEADRYGKLYARFKARVQKEEQKEKNRELYYGDIDEDEYYY